MSDSEDDFMSDKFLKPAAGGPASAAGGGPGSVNHLTYAERRRRAKIASEDRGRTKSRQEREREAREAALARDLILDPPSAAAAAGTGDPAERAGESKAVKMMRKMGFQPGQALGVKRSAPGDEVGKSPGAAPDVQAAREAPPSEPSTPAAAAPPPPPTDDRIIAPLAIHVRGPGKAGIGVPGTAPSRLQGAAFGSAAGRSLLARLTPDETAQRDAWIAASRSRFDGRKVQGQLRSARRTLEELDRRGGIEASVLWLDPDDVEREERKKLKRELREDYALPLSGEEPVGAGRYSGRKLAGLTGEFEGKVVDIEGEEIEDADQEEREAWFALEPSTRLATVLERLRQHHQYCLWCGAQYDSAQDLEDNCPGEDEDDH